MKRLALLAAVLVLMAIFVSSPLLASPPRIESRFARLQSFFVHCVTHFIGPFAGYVEILPPDGDGRDDRLGGDADDYANGRTGGEESKRDGRLKSGPVITGPTKSGSVMSPAFKE